MELKSTRWILSTAALDILLLAQRIRIVMSFNSIRRTIDAIADPEVVEMNLATMPGLKQEGLTTNLLRTCEDRADALAIIDLPGGFSPREDGQREVRNNTESSIRDGC